MKTILYKTGKQMNEDIDFSKTRGIKLPDGEYDWYLEPKEIKSRILNLQKAIDSVMDIFNGERGGKELSGAIENKCHDFWNFIHKLEIEEGYARRGDGKQGKINHTDIPFIRLLDDDSTIDHYYDETGEIVDDFDYDEQLQESESTMNEKFGYDLNDTIDWVAKHRRNLSRREQIQYAKRIVAKWSKDKAKRESIEENLNEEFGVDYYDTYNWVCKKRPDLSPAAAKKFAMNIIAKRRREQAERIEAEKQEPKQKAYVIFGDYDETQGVPTVRPAFCYADGELEMDMNFDVFSIEKRFEENLYNTTGFVKPGKYSCEYKGKPCTFYVWYSKYMHGETSGLVCYDTDEKSKEYIMKIMKEDSLG